MNNRRFVKSYTDWIRSKIWKDDALFKLYHYGLYKACYTRKKWKGLWLEPGEFPMAQRAAAEELGWSVNFLRKSLRELEKMGLITQRSDRRGTVVRIIDPERLLPEATDVSPDDTSCITGRNTDVSPDDTSCITGRNTDVSPDDTGCITGRYANVSPDDTYIEYIEYTDRHRNLSEDRESPTGFTDFWLAYPAERRAGMAEATGCYEQAIRSGATPETLMMILEEDKASALWRRENGRYIPGMVKWFEKEKWRDRVPEPRGREEQLWKSR